MPNFAPFPLPFRLEQANTIKAQQENTLSDLRVAVERAESENQRAQKSQRAIASDLETLRLRYNDALEEIAQMKQLHVRLPSGCVIFLCGGDARTCRHVTRGCCKLCCCCCLFVCECFQPCPYWFCHEKVLPRSFPFPLPVLRRL